MATRKWILLVLSVYYTALSGFGQLSIKGIVRDAESGETLPFSIIKLKVNGELSQATKTDADGTFQIELNNVEDSDSLLLTVYQFRYDEFQLLLKQETRSSDLEIKMNVLGTKWKDKIARRDSIVQSLIIGQEGLFDCRKNEDCQKVKLNLCGCNNGGVSLAINREFVDLWNISTDNKIAWVCPAVLYCYDEPKCKRRKCTLKQRHDPTEIYQFPD